MNVDDALMWWRKRIERVAAGIEGLPKEAVLTVEFERLAREALAGVRTGAG